MVLRHTTRFMANLLEVSIFFWLGVVSVQLEWHLYADWLLILYVNLFCLLIRFIVTFGLSLILNFFRDDPLSLADQVVCGFGGLRGGIALGLIGLAPFSNVETKEALTCVTVSVILFTAFVQGILMKPLVKLLKIPCGAEPKESLRLGDLKSKTFLYAKFYTSQFLLSNMCPWSRQIFRRLSARNAGDYR